MLKYNFHEMDVSKGDIWMKVYKYKNLYINIDVICSINNAYNDVILKNNYFFAQLSFIARLF